MTADKLIPGERCRAAGKGFGAKAKLGVVASTLDKRYMVLLDGETEPQPFSLAKVKRLARKPAPGAGQTEGFMEAIRGQRPTRLTIPDANVPAVPVGTPTELRDGQPLPATSDAERQRAAGNRFNNRDVWYGDEDSIKMRPQPKPRKPSRSEAFLQHVREHDCCNCGAPGPSDPDHVGARGVGQKCSDLLTIPLCRRCHRFRTDHNGLPRPGFVDENKFRPVVRHDSTEVILRAQVQMLREFIEKELSL